MTNYFKQFQELFGKGPLQVGEVQAVNGGVAVVELVGGAIVHARGAGQEGQRVFVRDGVIEGEAPLLVLVQIEI